LTRQLLLFSRKQIMQPKTLELNRLLQGLENTLQRLLGESSAVKFNLAFDTPPIRADAAMMEQVIVNLAVNARESMPRGGQFTVSTAAVEIDSRYVLQKPEARAGRFSCVTVVDTGCGFDPANLNRLFEPFFPAKGNGKGMGVGLAAVYGIVKQHNGWIEVTSQPGQGTTFKIFLPSESKAPATVTATPPGVPGGDERILLVEDEPGLCTMVESILRRYGYQVFTAPNGVDALQLWKQQKGEFDLLLTDMVMPEGVTGQQLAEKLKAQNPALKVIYSSGYSADLVSGEGMELSEGLNFLQKPYHPQKLAKTVRDCLDAPEPESVGAAERESVSA
jgi:two-component system cell cycle sensor histidine kinase/response regulator CckA